MKINTTKTAILAFVLSATASFAQNITDYERIYYSTPESIEESEITLDVKVPVAQADHSKFRLEISNNSNDIVVYNSSKSTFKYEFGEMHPAVKPVLIFPGKSKAKTLLVKGGDLYRQKAFDVVFGGLSKILVDGTTIDAPDYKLPAAKNSFTVGNFKVTLKKYGASTKEAKAVFECTYTGNDVALVNSANLSVKTTNKKTGEEVIYSNDNKKNEMQVLRKGDKVQFSAVFHIPGKIADMQFATMFIQWNDTFIETTEVPVAAPKMHFEMDEALTIEKK